MVKDFFHTNKTQMGQICSTDVECVSTNPPDNFFKQGQCKDWSASTKRCKFLCSSDADCVPGKKCLTEDNFKSGCFGTFTMPPNYENTAEIRKNYVSQKCIDPLVHFNPSTLSPSAKICYDQMNVKNMSLCDQKNWFTRPATVCTRPPTLPPTPDPKETDIQTSPASTPSGSSSGSSSESSSDINQTLMYVGIGVGGLVVVLLLIFVARRRK